MANIDTLLTSQVEYLDTFLSSLKDTAETDIMNAMLNLDSLYNNVDTYLQNLSFTPDNLPNLPTFTEPSLVPSISPDDNILPSLTTDTFTTVTDELDSLSTEIGSLNVSTDISELLTTISNLKTELSDLNLSIDFNTNGISNIIIPEPDNIDMSSLMSNIDIPEPTIPTQSNFDIDPKLNYIINQIYTIVKNPSIAYGSIVEDGIFNRAKERELELLRLAEEKELSTWASRGFSLPSSIINSQLKVVREKFYDDKLTVSRDIMTKQAEIAFEYKKVIIQLIENVINREYQFIISKAEHSLKYNELVNNLRNSYYNLLLSSKKTISEIISVSLQKYAHYLEYIKILMSKETTILETQKSEIEYNIKLFNESINLLNSKASIIKTQLDTLQSQIQLSGIKSDFIHKKMDTIVKLQEILNSIPIEKFKGDLVLKSENLKKNTEYYKSYSNYLDTLNKQIEEIYKYSAQINDTKAKFKISIVDAYSKSNSSYIASYASAITEHLKIATSLLGAAVQAKHIGIQINGSVGYSGDVDQMPTP